MGRPEEIATVALFLASGEASFVNGVELSVGGGFSPSESAVTKSRLVPADRARSGTWPCHAETADLGVPEPRPPVELPILPHIVPVPASVRHGYWWLGLLSPGIPCRDVSYRPDWDSTLSESSGVDGIPTRTYAIVASTSAATGPR
jgi:hypothetical protein